MRWVDKVRVVFTEEDRKNLKLLVEEIPRLRLLIEELMETIDVLGSEEELNAIKKSLEQVRRGETKDWDSYVKELKEKDEI